MLFFERRYFNIVYESFYKRWGIPVPRLNTCVFFILVQISCFRKFVLIKAFNYLTFTTVTGILNTGVHISLKTNYGLPALYLPVPLQNSEG